MTPLNLGRLLIVDDEIQLMTALCEMLTEQGYEAVGFASGQEAVQALREQDFDLLLTDLMMPAMDGIELLRAGLEIDPNLVGILMTGQGTVQTAVGAMKVGAFDYILKPFKLQALLPVLSRAMAMRRLRLENVQLRETVAIHELTQAIAFTLDLSTILNKVADAALGQLEADEASLMLPTDAGDELHIVVVRGEGREPMLGERVPIEQGIAGWVARQREPLLLQGKVADERFAPLRPRSDIVSSVSIPMLMGGKLVGVLNVNATNRRRPFTLGEVKALGILASTASTAIEAGRQYQQAREAEAKYRSIFENAVEGIFQTMPDGRYIAVNPALARLYGYTSPQELIAAMAGSEHQLYVDPHRRAEFIRLLEEKGEVGGVDAQVYRKDRGVIWISTNARGVREPNGTLLRYEGIVRDITERKQAEEALQKAHDELEMRVEERTSELASINKELQASKESADVANHAKSEFLSRMSHELRTPLNSVLGFGRLLQRSATDDKERERIGFILSAAEHLLKLINEVLDIASVEAGHLQLSMEPVRVGEVAGEAVSLMQPLAARRAMTIDSARLDEGSFVLADRQRLKQVLLNLLSNAIKYGHHAGQVRLWCEVVASAAHGEKLRIAVTNTGAGIAPDLLPRLFTPFERLGADRTDIEGTGLGLAFSKRLTEAMGGTISLHSKPADGTREEGETTFWIEMLLTAAPPQRLPDQCPPSAALPAALPGSFHLLYIDDNRTNLQLIESIVADLLSCQLTVAMLGGMGLELARQHHPDVILLDLHLPDMSGEEVLRRLRADPALASIPVVMLSADATPGQVRRLLDRGARHYLTKPIDVNEFVRIINGLSPGGTLTNDKTRR